MTRHLHKRQPGPMDHLDTVCDQRGLWLELVAVDGDIETLQIRNGQTKKVVATRTITGDQADGIDRAAHQLLEDITT